MDKAKGRSFDLYCDIQDLLDNDVVTFRVVKKIQNDMLTFTLVTIPDTHQHKKRVDEDVHFNVNIPDDIDSSISDDEPKLYTKGKYNKEKKYSRKKHDTAPKKKGGKHEPREKIKGTLPYKKALDMSLDEIHSKDKSYAKRGW